MSERIIFNHEEATRFIVGTIGIPGERAFFIQVNSVFGRTTVAVEKSQVVALEERLRELITEVRRSKLASLDELELAATIDNAELEFPIEEAFNECVLKFNRLLMVNSPSLFLVMRISPMSKIRQICSD